MTIRFSAPSWIPGAALVAGALLLMDEEPRFFWPAAIEMVSLLTNRIHWAAGLKILDRIGYGGPHYKGALAEVEIFNEAKFLELVQSAGMSFREADKLRASLHRWIRIRLAAGFFRIAAPLVSLPYLIWIAFTI